MTGGRRALGYALLGLALLLLFDPRVGTEADGDDMFVGLSFIIGVLLALTITLIVVLATETVIRRRRRRQQEPGQLRAQSRPWY